ncbi:MAG: GNAT family N-acetyltransferase [Thalassolituus oleivorans]|uniref:GNAT family N-acetyltransferase n=1 Tax=Thalassolituus oleivorans TaxID=187493 RepID=UPI001B7B5E8A|nr:GNAT family N-acetyltransferase [Thalassolituus oleivorans]MBQ0727700.1 GNAT family N-acetyltransferase [Thalassolituus oleivorans]MBQ0780489.1 GNAT family N-acetyltransferase [Thalassolituus oleivorans]
MVFEKVTLNGNYVRLEPLTLKHKEGLSKAIADGQLWKLFFTFIPSLDEVDDYIFNAKIQHDAGDGLTFAIIDQATNQVAGSTRFAKASIKDGRVAIGYTFLGKSFQRTKINTEAKLLMLKHAFEKLDLNRVEFATDYLNTTSRNALLRLGAKQEGIIRNHMIMPDGRVRDTVMFSIIKNEWLGVQQHLKFKIAKKVNTTLVNKKIEMSPS